MNPIPLTQILDWFLQIDTEIQNDFVHIACYFHPDEELRKEFDSEEKTQKLVTYLSSSSLTHDEIIRRTLVTVGLFDMAFVGRDTEQGWDKAMDNNLDARSRMVAKGMSGDFIDKALENWQHRKYSWIHLAKSWNELKNSYLTPEIISEWYFSAILR